MLTPSTPEAPRALAPAIILRDTLRLEGETLPEFAAQLGRLTPEDKAELVTLGAAQLGVTVA